eukprot:8688501-Pyramimonas_sp.AAC.1
MLSFRLIPHSASSSKLGSKTNCASPLRALTALAEMGLHAFVSVFSRTTHLNPSIPSRQSADNS